MKKMEKIPSKVTVVCTVYTYKSSGYSLKNTVYTNCEERTI